MAMTCARCGQKQGLLSVLAADLGGADFVCSACQESDRLKQEKARQAETQRQEALKQIAKQVVVTTTPGLDGFKVRRYLGIESVEFVIGTGIFSEVSTSIQDLFGSRSTAFEQKLQNAKKYAMFALKLRAAEKGANAVVGIDLDYSEFSGNRIALIINGTLVEAVPEGATA